MYGAEELNPKEFDNKWREVTHNLKVKNWKGKKLFLRVRNPDDSRKFDEFFIDLEEAGRFEKVWIKAKCEHCGHLLDDHLDGSDCEHCNCNIFPPYPETEIALEEMRLNYEQEAEQDGR